MPIVDKPLRELYEYEGINPKPADFDSYWDESLAEMKALDAEVTFTPAAFQTPTVACYDLWFTGVHGARIHCNFLKKRELRAPAPAVCVFHGYSGKAPCFSSLLNYAAEGFVVAALDCRGQAGESEDAGNVKGNTLHGHIIRGLIEDDPKKLLFRDIFLDCAQMAGIVMGLPYVDAGRVCATGGSQGGGLTLACAALEPRISKAAPWVPFLCDYRRVWDMDLDVDAYRELREFFRSFDPCHEREDEWFTKLGYIDAQHLAPRIRAEVMMGTGLMDTVCPPSTQFAAYNKITSKKSVVLYPDYSHEELPGFADKTFEFFLRG